MSYAFRWVDRRVPVSVRMSMTMALVFATPLLRAQTPETAQTALTSPTDEQRLAEAETLFQEGRALMDAGKVPDACTKLAKSHSLDPAAGTLLNLALCYERNGQVASAWDAYSRAATASQASGRTDWAKHANEKVTKLAPRVGRIAIETHSEAQPTGFEILRDGRRWARAQWAIGVPVDPGAHVIAARAAGTEEWSTTVAISPDGGTVTIVVPTLEPRTEERQPQPPSDPRDGVAEFVPATSHRAEPKATRVVGLAVGGVGLAALAVGSVFGVLAIGSASDAKVLCPNYPKNCKNNGVDPYDAPRAQSTISTVALVSGGSLIVGGAILYLLAPSQRAATNATTATRLVVGTSSTGVTFGLGGHW